MEGDGDEVEGLLKMVKNKQSSDSCRAYQCIKTLVTASSKSVVVKEYLIQNCAMWQWSVNWLKSKMGGEAGQWSPDHGTSSTSTTSAVSHSSISNEDSATKTFHRTISAQVQESLLWSVMSNRVDNHVLLGDTGRGKRHLG